LTRAPGHQATGHREFSGSIEPDELPEPEGPVTDAIAGLESAGDDLNAVLAAFKNGNTTRQP